MPRIEQVEFTKLVADGKVYRAPCIVYRDSVDGRWWRANGMEFAPGDFDTVVEKQPETVILGTGVSMMVRVLDETVARFESAGIACEVMDSRAAAERFNALYDSGTRVAAAFHLM